MHRKEFRMSRFARIDPTAAPHAEHNPVIAVAETW